MIKHLQREAHGTRSAVEVQHGSSPHAISTAALHPWKASPKSEKNVQASSMRSPPDEIARWGSAWLFPSGLQWSPPDQISRWGSTWVFTLPLPLRPYHPQRFVHQKLHPFPTECSSIFNAKPTGPSPPLTFSMVHLILLPSPMICPSGGIEALLSLNCHLVHDRKKNLLWSADFPLV